MAYDKGLADRLADTLPADQDWEERKMFGGVIYMLYNKMCVGVFKECLIVRIGEVALQEVKETDTFLLPMNITGKSMKGWAMIHMNDLEEDRLLQKYIDLSVAFVSQLEMSL